MFCAYELPYFRGTDMNHVTTRRESLYRRGRTWGCLGRGCVFHRGPEAELGARGPRTLPSAEERPSTDIPVISRLLRMCNCIHMRKLKREPTPVKNAQG